MNTKTVNTKRLVALAAVVIICAAALVSVAYAYNATYKDTVSQQGLTPEETAKYVYIGSDASLSLPTLTANVAVTYDTVTYMQEETVTLSNGTQKTYGAGSTVATPTGYSITNLTGPTGATVKLVADTGSSTGTLYVKIGTITVFNKNVTESNVFNLSVDQFMAADVVNSTDSSNVSVLANNDGKLQGSDICFVTSGADASVTSNRITQVDFTNVAADTNTAGDGSVTKHVDVDVYAIASVKLNYATDSGAFGPDSVILMDGVVPKDTLTTYLVVPGITTLTIKATDASA